MSSPADHLLYVLLDSNLPTGGFVASSGLESWAKHGFLHFDPTPLTPSTHPVSGSHTSDINPKRAFEDATNPKRRPANQAGAAAGVTDFAEAEIHNYHSSTGPFLRAAWELVTDHLVDVTRTTDNVCNSNIGHQLDRIVSELVNIDNHHDACLLSHVSRRASKAQGVAMLTLYTKGLCAPIGYTLPDIQPTEGQDERDEQSRQLIEAYKLAIRRGTAHGHLSVCWGAMTAALSIPLEQAIHLHLFLHARSILSAAVRLNLIGPYLSSQLLLYPFKDIIDRQSTMPVLPSHQPHSTHPASSGRSGSGAGARAIDGDQVEHDIWGWTDEADSGPCTTWPLGELLMARHDLQHSRIFNS